MNKTYIPRFSARKKNKDNMRLLLSSDTFQKEVAHFRGCFGIKSGGNTPSEHGAWLHSVVPHMVAYLGALNSLIRSYLLPDHYHRHIRAYIETGLISWPVNNFAAIPAGYTDQVATAKIFTDLTQDEAEDMNAEVKHLGKGLPFYGTIKDLNEMLESEQLYKVRDEFNRDEDREYLLTVKEQDKRGAKQRYEHKRTLDEQRLKRFGKK